MKCKARLFRLIAKRARLSLIAVALFEEFNLTSQKVALACLTLFLFSTAANRVEAQDMSWSKFCSVVILPDQGEEEYKWCLKHIFTEFRNGRVILAGPIVSAHLGSSMSGSSFSYRVEYYSNVKIRGVSRADCGRVRTIPFNEFDRQYREMGVGVGNVPKLFYSLDQC